MLDSIFRFLIGRASEELEVSKTKLAGWATFIVGLAGPWIAAQTGVELDAEFLQQLVYGFIGIALVFLREGVDRAAGKLD